MKRTFAIIAVLATALALPAVAGATVDNAEQKSPAQSSATVDTSVLLGDISATVDTNLDPQDNTAVEFSGSAELKSNADFDIILQPLTLDGTAAAAGDSISLAGDNDNAGSSNGDAGAGNEYQVSEFETLGGTVDWTKNAGVYEGTAVVDVTAGY